MFVFLLTCHGKPQLWDFDRIGKDKLIGTLRLPISKAAVQDSPPTPSWHTVHLELHETGSGAVNTTAVIQRPELLVGMQVRGALLSLRMGHPHTSPALLHPSKSSSISTSIHSSLAHHVVSPTPLRASWL